MEIIDKHLKLVTEVRFGNVSSLVGRSHTVMLPLAASFLRQDADGETRHDTW